MGQCTLQLVLLDLGTQQVACLHHEIDILEVERRKEEQLPEGIEVTIFPGKQNALLHRIWKTVDISNPKKRETLDTHTQNLGHQS
jgi:hypothetical protein